MPPAPIHVASLPLGGKKLTPTEWARLEQLLDTWKLEVLQAARRHPAKSFRLGVEQIEAFTKLLAGVPGAVPRAMFGGSGPSMREAQKWMRTYTLHELDDSLNAYIGKIKDALLYGLTHQVNPTQVASWLYNATKDARVNWQLIARTEMVRANAVGRLHACKAMGFDRVWVPPHVGSCRSCKELLENQVFLIDDLLKASNYGRPQSEWVACVPLHPRCRHGYLPYVAEVYDDAMEHYQGLEAAGLTDEDRLDELFDSSGQLREGVTLSDGERDAITWKTADPWHEGLVAAILPHLVVQSQPGDVAKLATSQLRSSVAKLAPDAQHTREVLQLDELQPALHQRAIDPDKVLRYQQAIARGAEFPPIEVHRWPGGQQWIENGQHRAWAARLAGLATIAAIVRVVAHPWDDLEPQAREIVGKVLDPSFQLPASGSSKSEVDIGKLPTSIDDVLIGEPAPAIDGWDATQHYVSGPDDGEFPAPETSPLDPLLFDGLRLRDDIGLALEAWWARSVGEDWREWSWLLLPAQTRIPVVAVDYDRARAVRPEWRRFSDDELHYALLALIAAHRGGAELAPGVPMDARILPLHAGAMHDGAWLDLVSSFAGTGPLWYVDGVAGTPSMWVNGEPPVAPEPLEKTAPAYAWVDGIDPEIDPEIDPGISPVFPLAHRELADVDRLLTEDEFLSSVEKAAAAAPANAGVEHWITVHPHGDQEKGQPVLVRNGADGSMTVIGGAGGNLNYLRLDPSRRIDKGDKAKGSKIEQHVSAAEAEESAAQRQHEVETAQANLAQVSAAKKGAMADYHSFLSDVLGQDVAGMDRGDAAKLLKDVRNSAARTLAYGPLVKREAAEGATEEELGLKTKDQGPETDATDTPDAAGEGTGKLRPKLALSEDDARSILDHLDALRGYDRIASAQRKIIGGDTKGSDALQVDWTQGGAGAREKRIASQVEQTIRTDLARDLVSWSSGDQDGQPVPHALRFRQAVAQGGYDSIDAFSYSVLGKSVLTREAHDLLGIAGSAQLVAHAIQQRATELGTDGLDLAKVGQALDQLRTEQESAIVDRGLQRARRATAEAAEARVEEAKTKAGEASLYTTTMAKSMQARKLQEAGRALGSMVSGLEAASALRVGLERKAGEKIKVGGFKTPSQILQLAEKARVKVTAADIVRVGAGNYTLAIAPERLQKLLKPQAAGNAALRSQLEGIRNAGDLEAHVQAAMDGPGMAQTLDENQARGKLWLLAADSGVLGFDPGVGKTHTAIAAAMHLMATEPDANHKAMIVCPANMVRSWQATIQQQGSHSVSAVGVHDADPSKDQSDRKKRVEQLTRGADFTIVPYESLAAYRKHVTPENGHTIVVADELQKAKDEQRGAFGAVEHAIDTAPAEHRHFWGLTGTAIEKKVGDLQSMVKLSMKAKGQAVPERGEWDRKYGKTGQDEHIARSDRVRQFRQGLDEHLFRLTAAAAGNDLEHPGRETHQVTLHPEHRKALEEKVSGLNRQIAEAKAIRDAGGQASGPEFGGRRAMLNALYKPENPQHNALAAKAADIVAKLGTHQFAGMAKPGSPTAQYGQGDHAGTYAHKAVIFGTEVQPLMQVKQHLEAQGVKVFEGHGGVTNAQNDRNMKAFLAHPDKAVFLTSDKNNAGVSLQFGDNSGRFQHGATHMIHFTKPENNAKIQQREARILRKGAQASFTHHGQKVPAVYHELNADTPVERNQADLLARERRTQDLVGNSDQKVSVGGEDETTPLAHLLAQRGMTPKPKADEDGEPAEPAK